MNNFSNRWFNYFIILVLLFSLGASPVSASSPQAASSSTLTGFSSQSLSLAVEPESHLAPTSGETISGTLPSDMILTGFITVTGDITIPVGVVISVTVGTTIQMENDDALASGYDHERIEWLVYGELQAEQATFTSQEDPPSEGDWYGIHYLPDSNGYLEGCDIAYGLVGVWIDTASPDLEENVIHHMGKVAGESGGPGSPGNPGTPGGSGTMGVKAYGIIIEGSSASQVISNTIHDIWGGNGGNGGDGGGGAGGAYHGASGGAGGAGGSGGSALGILVSSNDTNSHPTIDSNEIYLVYAGAGGNGGDGGPGQDGADGPANSGLAGGNGGHGGGGGEGGDGGAAFGISMQSAGGDAEVHGNHIYSLYGGAGMPGGNGGNGGDGGTGGSGGPGIPGGPGGTGGNGGPGGDSGHGSGVYGIFISDSSFATLDNDIEELYGGAGATGGYSGYGGAGGSGGVGATEFDGGPGGQAGGGNPGGAGGEGGQAVGIEVISATKTIIFNVSGNSIDQVIAGSGGDGGVGRIGGAGGVGGSGDGIYVTGLQASPNLGNNTISSIDGGDAGNGGDGGDGGNGASGGMGGAGMPPFVGNGGRGANGLAGGSSGRGGQGGEGFGIYIVDAVINNPIRSNTVAFIFSGNGGNGGNGGDGGAGGSGGMGGFGGGVFPGGNGGNGGNGGAGGNANKGERSGATAGLKSVRSTCTWINNLVHDVMAGLPGYGGNGGNGGSGGDGGDAGMLQMPGINWGGLGGSGGNGGNGANGAYGGVSIGAEANLSAATFFNNTAADVADGHTGGTAGTGGAGGGVGYGGFPVGNPGQPPTPGLPGINGLPGLTGDSYGVWAAGATITMTNNIVAHAAPGVNDVGIMVNPGSTAILSYNDVWTHTTQYSGVAVPATHIHVDPEFVSWGSDDFHLNGCDSPAAEAGRTVPVYTDGADGDPRPWGFYDMGYDEYLPDGFHPTAIGGNLAADRTLAGEQYLLTRDLNIQAGVTLTIEAGAQVQVNPFDIFNRGVDNKRIEVIGNGSFVSAGSDLQSVVFTGAGCSIREGQWYGVRYLNNGSMRYTTVEYATHAVEINTAQAIHIDGSVLRYNRDETGAVAVNAIGAGLWIKQGNHHIYNTEIYSNTVLALAGGNATGGGVALEAGNTLFENCLIYGNSAHGPALISNAYGGGVALLGGGAPVLNHCEIYDNLVIAGQDALGGGVHIGNSNAIITGNSWIHNNDAVAISRNGYGGGISILQDNSLPIVITPLILDSTVERNTCFADPLDSMGGCVGGGIGFYASSNTLATIQQNQILSNTAVGVAAVGGGIGFAEDAVASLIDGNLIQDNQTQGHGGSNCGGGIGLMYGGRAFITNNLIIGNEVTLGLGGGGGICGDQRDLLLVNNTIVLNTVNGWGGGICVNRGVISNTLVISNSASMDGGGVYINPPLVQVGYNDVWGNTCSSVNCGSDYMSGYATPLTDIFADPLFLGSGEVTHYFHLRQGSPAIDAGESSGFPPLTDYDHQARPLGASHDIGFDEVAPFWISMAANSDTAFIGDWITYTITLSNLDNLAAILGGSLSDVLPPHTTYISGPTCNHGACNYDPTAQTISWSGDLQPEEMLVLEYIVSVDRGLLDGTTITNTAYYHVGSLSGWTNQVSTQVLAPVFNISSQASANPLIGEPFTYTLTLLNIGHGAGTGVVVKDNLPDGANYITGGSYAGGVITWSGLSVPPLGSNNEATFVITTCQAVITNTTYWVYTSTQGISSPYGLYEITFLTEPTIPVAIEHEPQEPKGGVTVTFTATAVAYGNSITEWDWDFGDGFHGTGLMVSHAYLPGTYYVTLTITHRCGFHQVKTFMLIVNPWSFFLPMIIR